MTEEPPACPGSCSASGDPVWCPPCRRAVRSALVEIDRLVLWLEQQADGYTARRADGVGGRSGNVPSPAPVIDLLDEAYSDLVAIERDWRKRQGYAPVRRVSPGRTAHDRSMTLAFLTRYLDGMLLEPRMVGSMRRVLRWQTVLQRVARSEPERTARPGRCPRCHMVNVLSYDPASGLVKCRNIACPLEMTSEEYANEVLARPDAGVVPETRRALGLDRLAWSRVRALRAVRNRSPDTRDQRSAGVSDAGRLDRDRSDLAPPLVPVLHRVDRPR